jgi:hypothetical protein
VAGIASHYRKAYQSEKLEKIPLLAHIVSWSTLGLNLYAHSTGSVWSTVFLGLGAFVAYGMSIYAKKMSIEWLCICDRLVSLLLAMLTVISLHKFGLSGFEISIIGAIVAIIFFRVSAQSIIPIVFRVANAVSLLAYGVVAVQLFALLLEQAPIVHTSIGLLAGSFLILGFIMPYIQQRAEEMKLGIPFQFEKKMISATFL